MTDIREQEMQNRNEQGQWLGAISLSVNIPGQRNHLSDD